MNRASKDKTFTDDQEFIILIMVLNNLVMFVGLFIILIIFEGMVH